VEHGLRGPGGEGPGFYQDLDSWRQGRERERAGLAVLDGPQDDPAAKAGEDLDAVTERIEAVDHALPVQERRVERALRLARAALGKPLKRVYAEHVAGPALVATEALQAVAERHEDIVSAIRADLGGDIVTGLPLSPYLSRQPGSRGNILLAQAKALADAK